MVSVDGEMELEPRFIETGEVVRLDLYLEAMLLSMEQMVDLSRHMTQTVDQVSEALELIAAALRTEGNP